MKIIIDGDSKELAALVLAIQERQTREITFYVDAADIAKTVLKATRDKPQACED